MNNGKSLPIQPTDKAYFYAWCHQDSGYWLSDCGWVPELYNATIFNSPTAALQQCLSAGSVPANGRLTRLEVLPHYYYDTGSKETMRQHIELIDIPAS